MGVTLAVASEQPAFFVNEKPFAAGRFALGQATAGAIWTPVKPLLLRLAR